MIWKFIRGKLKRGQKVVLLVVVDSKGSSPGKKGFKMSLSEDGDQCGSIGGGAVEYRLIDQAAKVLQNGKGLKLVKMVHDEDDPDHGSGMICAGSQKVAIVFLDPDDLSLFERMIGSGKGVITIDQTGISFDPFFKKDDDEFQYQEMESEWVYKELLGIEPEIYIYGGGHVGLALSKLMKDLNFKVTVLDNREKTLKTLAENVFAHHIQIIDYDEADEYIPEGNNVYVVIMTSDHLFDGLILEQMIPKKIKYLGMLGSEQKVKKTYRILERTGLSAMDFAHIDSPAGLTIASQTPMEIAVSIAAKIISVKNDNK
jgi:xanthine dehydrogenase accessory factor